ncbi:Plasmid stabilization system protein ParE [Xaviernesmea oryzae]|uniref:Plasmid stabilization system protein ParE n=1 Tax=Xaviernesmea oryzae TaxID=464029 RepID=A0A1X7FGK3_9HYPH|nr:type II toxin-antitoxin system RelE/ParE family toxin [Xaviernesmea oryzae]SMF51827.1 Plasmid stabilization system protein ParE [Xaviernesmea oryzae]
MTRALQWSREALDDLKKQIAYIADRNPAAARRAAERIDDAVSLLGGLATGRPGRVKGTHEKVIPNLPYIETITIHRLIHTSRDWREDNWPE